MSTSPRPSSHRIAELDALRGIAALMVVIYHFTAHFQGLYGRVRPLAVDLHWATSGVWLFFMLSGYVIFMTLERTRSASDFVIGRFSRLYPAFWASLLTTFVVVSLCGLPGQEVSGLQALQNTTMMPRLFRAPPVDPVYWSLEFELWFYGAMLALWYVGALRKMIPVLAFWLLAATVAQCIRVWCPEESFIYRIAGKIRAVTSLDYINLFGVGMILYDVRRSGRWTWLHAALLVVCAALTFWLLPTDEAAISVGLALLLYLATNGRLPILNAKPLLWLGFVSYTVYLIHQNAGSVALRWFDAHGWEPHLAVLITLVGSLCVAAFLTYAIERPAMKMIREATKRRTSTQPGLVTIAESN